VVTESKAAFAGGIFEIFAEFKSSMASFNAEMAAFRPLGRRNLVSMVKCRGGCEKRVWREGCEAGPEFYHERLV